MVSKLTIILSGMIAGDPYQGGATWAVLQYWLGLRRLDHDVYFVEPIAESALRPATASKDGPPSPSSSYATSGDNHPPAKERISLKNSANAAYFTEVARRFNLEGRGALVLGKQSYGLEYEELRTIARRADLLINISGMLVDRDLIEPIRTRVYLDLDPAFNQLWQAVQGIDMRFAGHTHFVTIGLAIATPQCRVPTCGHVWIKTRQPVVLEHWPLAKAIAYDGLTTVGNWRGYGSIEHQGTFYGQKAHSLRRFIELPMLTRERFLPALAIHANESRDLASLKQHGWILLDPAEVASTADNYRRFIQGSKAEIGIAKSGYVASKCGWFSDRSVCYLASGRPVIAQETGFSSSLPVGKGLFAFDSVDEVLTAIDSINADYPNHTRAARALAEEYFDSDRVLKRLLEKVV